MKYSEFLSLRDIHYSKLFYEVFGIETIGVAFFMQLKKQFYFLIKYSFIFNKVYNNTAKPKISNCFISAI